MKNGKLGIGFTEDKTTIVIHIVGDDGGHLAQMPIEEWNELVDRVRSKKEESA